MYYIISFLLGIGVAWLAFEYTRGDEVFKLSETWRKRLLETYEQNRSFLNQFKQDTDNLVVKAEAAIFYRTRSNVFNKIHSIAECTRNKEVRSALLELSTYLNDLTIKELK